MTEKLKVKLLEQHPPQREDGYEKMEGGKVYADK